MATVKLASLFIRTLSKPLAASIKQQAKNHPKFKDFCVSIAQAYHSIDIKMKRRFLDYKSDVIRPLSETRAVELGANFIGESIIFSVAVITILGEIYRTSRNAKNQRETVDESIKQLHLKVEQLNTSLLKSHGQIQSLESQLKEYVESKLAQQLESVRLYHQESLRQFTLQQQLQQHSSSLDQNAIVSYDALK